MRHPYRFLFFVASVTFFALVLVATFAARIPSNACHLVGTNEQNGWAILAICEGNPAPPPSRNPAVRFFERIHRFLHKSDIEEEGYRAIIVQAPGNGPASDKPQSANGYKFTCALDNGFIYSLQVTFNYREAKEVSHQLLCELPTVPAECRTANVILTRDSKVVARWRIANLPHLTHKTIPQSATDWTQPVPGVRLKANWAARGFCSSASPVVSIDLTDSSSADRHLPAQESVQWRVKGLSAEYEWERTDPNPGFAETEGWLDSNGQENSCSTLLNGAAACFPITQWIRLSGILEQHVQKTESVTFHDVPVERRGRDWYIVADTKTLTQHTPDGVVVTVVPQGAQKEWGPRRFPDASDILIASYGVVLSSRGKPAYLPASTLFQKYKHEITVYGPHDGYPIDLLSALKGYAAPSEELSDTKVGILQVHRTRDHRYGVDITVPFLEDTIAESAPFASVSRIWPTDTPKDGTIHFYFDAVWR